MLLQPRCRTINKLAAVICDYCQNEAELVTGKAVYPHTPELSNTLYWKCDPCKARVGCHAGTVKPLGRLANARLRFWKMTAHDAFDPLWKDGAKTRRQAYQYLADKLGIDRNDCHIGMFDVETCKRVVEILTGEIR